VSTFNTTALPAMFAAVRATSGAAARHGLHQPAQKSTRTGTGLVFTISSNNCSSAASGSAIGGSGDLQEPQRPVLARNFAGMRFCVPQWLQVRMTGKRDLRTDARNLLRHRMPRSRPEFVLNLAEAASGCEKPFLTYLKRSGPG